MKPRADKFMYIANNKTLMRIQEEVQKYPKGDNVDAIFSLYLSIAIDEGYRHYLAETKERFKDLSPYIKAKRRRKRFVEYVDDGEAASLLPLINRREKSKRQLKARAEYCEEVGIENCEITFMLSMIINTGYEHGYMKACTLEETCKIIEIKEEFGEKIAMMIGDNIKELK